MSTIATGTRQALRKGRLRQIGKRLRLPKPPKAVMDAATKAGEGAYRLSRKLPKVRLQRPANPFKAGTSATLRRASQAAKTMGGAAGVLAATPGTGYIGGALGGLAAGPKGAAAGFAGGAALDYAATAALGMMAGRRAKLAGYLSRRKERKEGVYKARAKSRPMAMDGSVRQPRSPRVERTPNVPFAEAYRRAFAETYPGGDMSRADRFIAALETQGPSAVDLSGAAAKLAMKRLGIRTQAELKANLTGTEPVRRPQKTDAEKAQAAYDKAYKAQQKAVRDYRQNKISGTAAAEANVALRRAKENLDRVTAQKPQADQTQAAARRRNDKNNDGWVDGQKPKGAKPRKTAEAATQARETLRARDAAAIASAPLAALKERLPGTGYKEGVENLSDGMERLIAYDRLVSRRLATEVKTAKELAELLSGNYGRTILENMSRPKANAIHRRVTGKPLPQNAEVRDALRAAASADTTGAKLRRAAETKIDASPEEAHSAASHRLKAALDAQDANRREGMQASGKARRAATETKPRAREADDAKGHRDALKDHATRSGRKATAAQSGPLANQARIDREADQARAALAEARAKLDAAKERRRLASMPSAERMRAENDAKMNARLAEIDGKLKGTRYERKPSEATARNIAQAKTSTLPAKYSMGTRSAKTALIRAAKDGDEQAIAYRLKALPKEIAYMERIMREKPTPADKAALKRLREEQARLKAGRKKIEPIAKAFRFEFQKADVSGRYVRGWANVCEMDGEPVCDVQGDVIAMEEMRKSAHDYISNAREAKAMHDGDRIGDVVESVIIDDDFAKAHGIGHGKRGWWIGMEVHDPEVRKRVASGELRAFSIGGSGKRTPMEKRGEVARYVAKPRPVGLLGLVRERPNKPAARAVRNYSAQPKGPLGLIRGTIQREKARGLAPKRRERARLGLKLKAGILAGSLIGMGMATPNIVFNQAMQYRDSAMSQSVQRMADHARQYREQIANLRKRRRRA